MTICKRYDTQSAHRLQIEHTVISAIKALGPELVLTAIPLADGKGVMQLERSWLLPSSVREPTVPACSSSRRRL